MLASPVAVGVSGWTWGNPVPQGDTLNDVVFQGAVGYAVGDFAMVLRSEDGGHTWVGLPSESVSNLSLVQQLGADTVVVGGECTVSESLDGGASFQRMAIGQPEFLCPTKVASFSFLDTSNGFVEMADGSILATNDGGRTFEPKMPVPLDGGTAGGIVFSSPTIGVAVTGGSDGQIFRTTDGAGSWTQVAATPAPLTDVRFVGARTAYAVGASGTLLISRDEGATWTILPLALPAGTAPPALTHISCGDVLHCLMTTARGEERGKPNVLVRTTDGGMSGSIVASPSGQSLLGVSFANAQEVVAVGEEGATVLSSDGGATFGTVVSQNLVGNSESDNGGVVGLIRIGQSPLEAYAPWIGGRIVATTDGGNSWRLLSVRAGAHVVDVAFPTPTVGYAVEGEDLEDHYLDSASYRRMYRTVDGGATWKTLDYDGGPATAVLAPSTNTVLVIGQTGVFRSTDGGRRFRAVGRLIIPRHGHRRRRYASLPSLDLARGAQLAGGAIFAYGHDVLESTDGGLHWREIPRPLPRHSIGTISFVNASTGYETSDGLIFFTRNAGRNWTELPSTDAYAVNSPGQLSFSNASEGYMLSEFSGNPLVFLMQRTANGGRTWSIQAVPALLRFITNTGRYAYAASGQHMDEPAELFQTNDDGLDARSSTLTLSILGPHTLSRTELAQDGGRVRVTGQLSPEQGDSEVLLSYRALGHPWQVQYIPTNADGTYEASVPITATTDLFAQTPGDGLYEGAGTPAQQIILTNG